MLKKVDNWHLRVQSVNHPAYSTIQEDGELVTAKPTSQTKKTDGEQNVFFAQVIFGNYETEFLNH